MSWFSQVKEVYCLVCVLPIIVVTLTQASPVSHIINGEPAEEGAWPWIAYIKGEGVFKCIGSVINSRYVLTTSSCATRDGIVDISVVIGLYDQYEPNVGFVEEIEAEKLIIYQDTDGKRDADLALIKLKRPVSKNKGNVTIAAVGAEFYDEDCIILGWGPTDIITRLPSAVLRQAIVHVSSQEECESSAPEFLVDVYCAMGEEGAKSCMLDSGGPLLCPVRNTYVLAGVNVGDVCLTQLLTPSFYTILPKYRNWIDGNSKQ